MSETQAMCERINELGDMLRLGRTITTDDAGSRTRQAAALLTRQQETIDKYRARLEVDHVFRVVDGEMVRVECPEDDYPDGIECRDVTISELEGQLDAKRETIERLTEALETIAESHDAGRHDGLPEPCPAHEDVAMWAIARAALKSSDQCATSAPNPEPSETR